MTDLMTTPSRLFCLFLLLCIVTSSPSISTTAFSLLPLNPSSSSSSSPPPPSLLNARPGSGWEEDNLSRYGLAKRLKNRLKLGLGLEPRGGAGAPTNNQNQAAQEGAGINFNPDGSAFLWLPQDEYAGKTFFDRWDFFSDAPDPTNGHVIYVNQSTAVANNLVSVTDDGRVIMKGDDTTSLPMGQFRNSVRIASQTQYNTGLFVLDLNRAPWGCGVWPAFWTVGGNWPNNGEIDILEGVHDNEHNQIAWHTSAGCFLNPNGTFTGIVTNNGTANITDCDGNVNSNSGCSISEWSEASYGPFFEEQGGGVIAMKWDENSISVWSFYRAAIPADVTAGSPNPSQWGPPSATLDNSSCDITKFFVNHSIVFDITFCGDWAGASYATSGCPGTCDERLMDPTNFVNATWDINSLKVYRKQLIASAGAGKPSSANILAPPQIGFGMAWAAVFILVSLVGLGY